MTVSERDVDVIVVGGGIGGLSSALALARSGRRVRVLERAPEFAEVGAGLQIAPNATRILREWGVLDEVIGLGVLPRRLVFRDAVDGRELTHLPLGEEFVARYGGPYVVIHRSDLLGVLQRACDRAGVDLVPNCEVTDVETTQDTAVVRSAAGVQRADVAIGADGLRSRLRARLSDDEPVNSGYVAYRGAFPVEELETELDERALTDVVAYIGPGCHLVQYSLRGGEMFNTVAVFRSPGFLRGEAEYGGPEELDEVFAGACPQVRHGLKSLWRVRHWKMFDRVPVPNWVDGRMALTGDAAHPMLQYLAQGACQAIEDAHCLAAQAAASSGDWPVALKEYERVRTERTARVQTSARVWGDIWHVDGVARLLRNELFLSREPGDHRHVDWLYGA